jgi:hypothetical protein
MGLNLHLHFIRAFFLKGAVATARDSLKEGIISLGSLGLFFDPAKTRKEGKNMRRNVVPVALSLTLMLFLSAMTATPVAAQGNPNPITVGVGQAIDICNTGTIRCPAYVPICDDTSIATIRHGGGGLEIVGVSPGTTLCSVGSANFTRVQYTVTVR